ncbi:hypothetical protein BW716_15595 [[Flexibacter] sp. ATCC 35208]|nr:hypothetical protein BW716_15595 [[Flexibacter] sp. ATCC 35208]
MQKLLFLISEGIFSSINVADNIAMGYSHFCTEGSISNYPPDKNNFKGNIYVLNPPPLLQHKLHFGHPNSNLSHIPHVN